MAIPSPRVRIAFGALPGDGEPTDDQWETVTSFVRSISIRTGRSQDLDRIEAGTLVLELDNPDGRFTPENSQSPHYPDIRPFAQIEVSWVSEEVGAFKLGSARLGETDCALYDVA